MLNSPFSPWPAFTFEEGEAARDILMSNKVNYWTGDEGRNFEREFAVWSGVDHAVAVANGTVALDLAWIALGIGPGDEVIVTPRTFLASVSSIINCGATPVFADVDADSQNITPQTVAQVLTSKTKAVLLVHLAGWPCDMDGFAELARAYQLYLIEDCAQAHGALYRGRPVGGLGDIAAWSFCQDKIMTTAGEGGMVTTNNADWWEAMWSYKDHGKSHAAVYDYAHPPGFRWLHDRFGTNWRITEIQSAVGRIQLRRMSHWHEVRKANAQRLMDAARSIQALRVPEVPNHIEHAWYKAYVFVRRDALKSGWSRDRIIHEVVARGVPCYAGSCPEVYMEKAFEDTNLRPEKPLPVARRIGDESLMFLVHPSLTALEIDLTCETLASVMGEASR